MSILAIARNTFRENIRDRILYNLILFALIMILSSIALGQLTPEHCTAQSPPSWCQLLHGHSTENC